MKKYFQIKVAGLVQGVGFRPFVYRMAIKHKLSGTVENRNDGVKIVVNTDENTLQDFVQDIKTAAPPASMIFSVDVTEIAEVKPFSDFSIVKSASVSEEVTEVSPDIAVCSECMEDIALQANRLKYPFVNCTNCGPRFTIITDLPYDREKTSMHPFIMCDQCRKEYTDILDRRFHAQPVACNDCGPQYTMKDNEQSIGNIEDILTHAARLLEQGDVLAIKGLGGYFICCDAQNEQACLRIRNMKNRDGKPFAVMFRDMESLSKFAKVSEAEKELLTSWRRPIVLLKQREMSHPALNSGLDRIGCMLPYMPFHYLLFDKLQLPALVMTSGNFSEEPIIIDDSVAERSFGPMTSGVLSYNRAIANRCDDSVLFVVNEKARFIRRSRGYVPNPVRLSIEVEGILATGPELKNTFALGKGRQAILSQHIGDLKNLETFEFYEETIGRFSKLFRFKPTLIACDLHPDYMSTAFADGLNLPVIRVQHHHAHIASCLAEAQYDGKVIGVSFDGTGLGDDQAIWGGEFLLCDLAGYERAAHLEYVPLPGGDHAAKEPWRMAISYLNATFGDAFMGFDLPFLRTLDRKKVNLLLQGITQGLNCPPTSSAGRLFDAVSALTGICLSHSFEAEGPMLLEAMIKKDCQETYPHEYKNGILSFSPMIMEMVNDVLYKTPTEIIAARFHNTMINSIVDVCNSIAATSGLRTVALSGGVLMNAYILEHTEKQLIQQGFKVLTNMQVPANDGGIALGQLAVAAKISQLK